MKGWKCGNCGHIHVASESLAELSFQWLDEDTCKTSCENCGSYTIQRATAWEWGNPTAGYFLQVNTKNKIRKGR
jgi:predicted RNA-binding Zn-ribbon protein involved in translation (DUF1610 family)